jgi:hypothetical protein
MARSLTVNHQEKPGTNALFTGFLVFACVWLGLAAFAGFADASAPPSPPTAPVTAAK